MIQCRPSLRLLVCKFKTIQNMVELILHFGIRGTCRKEVKITNSTRCKNRIFIHGVLNISHNLCIYTMNSVVSGTCRSSLLIYQIFLFFLRTFNAELRKGSSPTYLKRRSTTTFQPLTAIRHISELFATLCTQLLFPDYHFVQNLTNVILWCY